MVLATVQWANINYSQRLLIQIQNSRHLASPISISVLRKTIRIKDSAVSAS